MKPQRHFTSAALCWCGLTVTWPGAATGSRPIPTICSTGFAEQRDRCRHDARNHRTSADPHRRTCVSSPGAGATATTFICPASLCRIRAVAARACAHSIDRCGRGAGDAGRARGADGARRERRRACADPAHADFARAARRHRADESRRLPARLSRRTRCSPRIARAMSANRSRWSLPRPWPPRAMPPSMSQSITSR